MVDLSEERYLGVNNVKKNPQRKRRIFSFKKGLATLIQALEEHLKEHITTKAEVCDISQQEDSWQVSYTQNGKLHKTIAKNIVYAGNAYTLSKITCNGQKLKDFAIFDEIDHPPVAVTTLGFKREDVKHPLDGFGFLVPKVENFQILGALFPSTLFPNRAPANHVAITTFVGGARQPQNALLEKR